MKQAALAPDLLHRDSYLRDPFPTWERLRHEAPLWHDAVADRWVVTRYDDVLTVLRDDVTYGVERPYRRFSAQIGRSLVNCDGREHAVRRSLVAPELVGRNLDAHAGRIRGRVEGALAAWPPRGNVDALATLIGAVPLLVISELLGLPPSQERYLARCSAEILAGLAGGEVEAARGRVAHQRLSGMFEPIIAARRREPTGDLISRIIGASSDGEGLSDAEINSFISLLLVAGGETAGLAIANLWTDLVGRPEILAAIREDPVLLDEAFSESLRFDGPVVAEDRTVNVAVELHGVEIPAGATIRAYIGSANNDEMVFHEPRRFDPGRSDLHRGKESRHGGRDTEGRTGHLTFGAGSHFCLGYQLARLEALSVTAGLVRRYRSVAFAPGREPSFTVALDLMRRVDRLDLVVG